MNFENLSGRFGLLAQLNPRDVAFLLRRKVYEAVDRRRFRARPDAPSTSEVFSLLNLSPGRLYMVRAGLQAGREEESLEALLEYYRTREGVVTPAVLFQRNRKWVCERTVEAILRRADLTMANRHFVRGDEPLSLPEPVDWHRDPESGQRWPDEPFWKIDFSAASGSPDVKFIWELNRHKHFYPLGQAYLLTGEERYAERIVSHLISWIEQNPPGWGVNWAGPLELGLRVMAWCWALEAVRESKALTADALACALVSIHQQLSHMDRYLEDYLTRNTHLVGEAAALAYAGMHFPELADASYWLAKGLRLLERELDRQLTAEGMHYERSVYYHNYMIDFCAGVYLLGLRNGIEFSPVWGDRLKAMFRWLASAAPPAERMPDVGDADGGVVFGWAERDLLGFRRRLALGAALFGHGEWKHQAGSEEDLLAYFFESEAIEHYQNLEPDASTAGKDTENPEWSICRGRVGGQETYLLFDYGPLGVGRAGHGHSDMLQLLLSVGNQPVLVDPGTYTYNGPAEWRDYYRATRGHNTLTIDEQDQSIPAGPFAWRSQAKCHRVDWPKAGGVRCIVAEHDGYQRLSPAAVHRRWVTVSNPDGLYFLAVVLDEIEREGESRVESFWHLAPGDSRWIPAERRVERDLPGDLQGHLLFPNRGAYDLNWIVGESAPQPQGWFSPNYGQQQQAPVVVRGERLAGNGLQVTVLAVTDKGKRPLSLTMQPARSGWQAQAGLGTCRAVFGGGRLWIKSCGVEAAAQWMLCEYDEEDPKRPMRIFLYRARRLVVNEAFQMDAPGDFTGTFGFDFDGQKYSLDQCSGERPNILTDLPSVSWQDLNAYKEWGA